MIKFVKNMSRLKKVCGLLLSILIFVMMFSGCGKDSPQDVKTGLQAKLNGLESYRSEGEMIIHSPVKSTTYKVKVAFRKPHFYRIELESKDRAMRQTVIRNDEGVFLVTPNLNKTFRFQSNWPTPQGQVYLYQTLLSAILSDSNGKITPSENGADVKFSVMAKYPHHILTSQNIVLDAKTYSPKIVEVLDEKSRSRITVTFTKHEENISFAADAFQVPTRTNPVTPQVTPKTTVSIHEPAYQPGGVAKYDEQTFEYGGKETLVQRFAGSYDYSVWSSLPGVATEPLTTVAESLVDLDAGFGLMESTDQLVWWQDGLEYRLHTSELPINEMIQVADSIDVWSQKP